MMTIEKILAMPENHNFDRKSIQVSLAELSATVCAFANAGGGTVAVGISDSDHLVEGVNSHSERLNKILRIPTDFCFPAVPVRTELVGCTNSEGKPDQILLMHIDASTQIHSDQNDYVFVRTGSITKKLDFNERLKLIQSKGVRSYEDEPVAGATIADIDLQFVASYCRTLGYRKTPEQYLRENECFVTVEDGCDHVSVAAILLFGKNPQSFFPKASVRFIRYGGNTDLPGDNQNVICDVTFEGRILEQVEKSFSFISALFEEKKFYRLDGTVVTGKEFCSLVCTELVVNAVVHRDYRINGFEINIRMFDNRIEILSPGTHNGIVELENILHTRFSRNPRIASFLRNFGYVNEFGEGVKQVCRELESMGVPAPVYDCSDFILRTVVMISSSSNVDTVVTKVADSS
ncbi:MAG: putative DNA binding domain-containing protein [Succinivibrionaceae bacterium]|nr:putative DNA binding domain-containing protein [Succinivibrionaceae bacterium]